MAILEKVTTASYLYEKRLEELDLVAILIDGIHLGKQEAGAGGGAGHRKQREKAGVGTLAGRDGYANRIFR